MGFELIMKIVKNKISDFILWKGYSAITIWPFIFVRSDKEIDDELINHEKIHGRQQLEMALIGFYLWYVVEWVVRLIAFGFSSFKVRKTKRFVYWSNTNKCYITTDWIRYSWRVGRKYAYRYISFEREAVNNESSTDYLEKRQWFAWFSYLQ